MKKIFLILIVSFILTGCGQNKNVTETSSTPQIDTSQYSNEKIGWGFRKIEGSRPEFTKGQIAAMEKFNCIYLGSDSEKVLYLTFDEGYENGYTQPILDTLKKRGVTAAFFVTGPYLREHADLVDQMVKDGHTVGNHTVNHPSMPDKSDEEVIKEITALNDIFYEKYGFSMKFFRPPMGEYSDRTLALTNSLGYTTVFWSFAYKDWETNNQKGADYTFKTVTNGLHNGGVLLLHAVSKDNAAALDSIITYAENMGYKFKSLEEYK